MVILGTRWAFWTSVCLCVAPCVLGAWSWVAADGPLLAMGGAGSGESEGAVGDRVPIDSLSTVARRTAPFRPDGRASAVPYDPLRSEAPAEYAPPKPALLLSGIMEGVAPVAVIEGIPGREGPVVLGVGDTIAGLRVKRIGGGQVTVTGMDTTWQLRLRGQ